MRKKCGNREHVEKLDVKCLKSKLIKAKCIKSEHANVTNATVENVEVTNVNAEKVVINNIEVNPFYAQSLFSDRKDVSDPAPFTDFNVAAKDCPVFDIPFTSAKSIGYPVVIQELGTDSTKSLQEMAFDIIHQPTSIDKTDNTTLYYIWFGYTTDGNNLYAYNFEKTINMFVEIVDPSQPLTEEYVLTFGVIRMLENAWQDFHLAGFLSQGESETLGQVQAGLGAPQPVSSGYESNTIYVFFTAQTDAGTNVINFCPGSKIQLIY